MGENNKEKRAPADRIASLHEPADRIASLHEPAVRVASSSERAGPQPAARSSVKSPTTATAPPTSGTSVL